MGYVDWFNLMSFDYHTPKNIPKTVGAHSDLKLIDSVVLELLKDTKSTKFVLGMAAYGRTYTLATSSCKELGCPFRSPGLGGCGKTPGFLPFNEIHEYIQNDSYDELYQDASSSSMVAVVDEDQMISFDDENTWAIKEAYAEMRCLRGTMLWSIDMLKPKPPLQTQRRIEGIGDRLLTTTEPPSNRCNFCGNSKVLSDVTVEYNGEIVSCHDIHNMLNSIFVPHLSDHCLSIHSKFSDACCLRDAPMTCDVCGHRTEKHLLESRQVSYAGETTCGSISNSLHSTREYSLACSVAKASLTGPCCADSCQMCSRGGEINADALIEHGGKQITCADYQSALKMSGSLEGSADCYLSVSQFSDTCCQANDEIYDVTSPGIVSLLPCNVCEKNNIHHELKSEAMVEYKGTSVSCLDLNSILAKSEARESDICIATQSMLFDGCCYEKCSLCGEKALKWDSTVKYDNQILSCDELNSMFILGSVGEGSDQCDAMKSAYSRTCCFKPPKNKCNLCNQGTTLLDVSVKSFVKTLSSSLYCVDLATGLAEREEEGSEVCQDSKLAYSARCCNSLSSKSSLPNSDSSYFEWLNEVLPSSSSFLKRSCWPYVMISLALLCDW